MGVRESSEIATDLWITLYNIRDLALFCLICREGRLSSVNILDSYTIEYRE